MSSVRMCDKCGNIFSELEEGWQTFTGATVKKSGTETVRMDVCSSCALVPQQERIALAARAEVKEAEKAGGLNV